MAFLKVCIPGCSDGFERLEHAIETQTPSRNSLAKPILVPLFLAGTGVAYNEAERVTGVRGVGPDRA